MLQSLLWCGPYRKDLGQQGGGEKGGVLDDYVVALVLVRHVQLVQQLMGGLAHLQVNGATKH